MKLGNVYNLGALTALKAQGSMGFSDSAGAPGIILAQQLNYINPRIFERKYPALAFVNSGIEVNNEGGYASEITSLRFEETGEFKNSSDKASNKGNISLTADDSKIKITAREAFSEWSDDEINSAKLANVNLVDKYLTSHNKIYLDEIDTIGLVGNSDLNNHWGLVGHPGFDKTTAPGTFYTETGKALYEIVSDFITKQHTAVNNIPEFMINVIIFPVRAGNHLQNTILDANATSRVTVLNALKENFPGINFTTSAKIKDAVGFSNSEDSMVFRIPVPLTIGQVIPTTSFHFRVDSKYRIGGLDVLEPSSGANLILPA